LGAASFDRSFPEPILTLRGEACGIRGGQRAATVDEGDIAVQKDSCAARLEGMTTYTNFITGRFRRKELAQADARSK